MNVRIGLFPALVLTGCAFLGGCHGIISPASPPNTTVLMTPTPDAASAGGGSAMSPAGQGGSVVGGKGGSAGRSVQDAGSTGGSTGGTAGQGGGATPPPDAGMPVGTDLTGYVNPFMGTTADGQSFPGAARPFGMIQWSLDNARYESNQYDYSTPNFAGFSFTHYTGYGPRVGVMLPYAGTVTTSPPSVRTVPNTNTVSPYESKFNHSDETATPGSYSVKSASGISVRLAVTDRAGVGSITWPTTGSAASLIFDLGNSQTSSLNSAPIYNQTVIDQKNQIVQGFAGKSDYRLYFVIEFDQPFSSVASFDSATMQPGQTTSSVGTDVGTVVTFAVGTTVNLRVGLSYVSLANAQMNLDSEIPAGTSIAQVSRQATDRWNAVLNRIVVSDPNASKDELTKFYTNLYEATIQPNVVSDVDGEYWGADNQAHTVAKGHAAYSTISAWDQGRGMWPLLAYLFPSTMSDVAQSYINVAQQSAANSLQGFVFPFLAEGSAFGFGPGPEYALPAQAYAFGATNFDTTTALKDLLAVSNSGVVRGGLQGDYLAGDSTPENHLDFSLTDFAVRRMALAVGDTATATALAGRAGKWKDTFDTSAVDNGFTGYQWFKSSATQFSAFTTSTDGTGSSTANRFTESCSAQDSYSVPQDVGGLITAMGGPTAFVSRYDFFFSQYSNIGSNFSDTTVQKSCRFFDAGNEPDLRAPWLANWAGGPSHVQAAVQKVLSTLFANTPSGLPGNNDWGAISSWYVCAALGLYPLIPGVGGFSVNTPRFQHVLLTFEDGHQLLVEANSSPWTNGYISSVAINGSSWDSTWIPIQQLDSGAALDTLEFGLQSTPSNWGASPSAATAPPSFGSD
ncbi:MAG TPA: GH92 family glycosyl hydrolase [Polyangia bacterium]|nr:GH92 family glycosyl hydrolase [Polyangia bacterium]